MNQSSRGNAVCNRVRLWSPSLLALAVAVCLPRPALAADPQCEVWDAATQSWVYNPAANTDQGDEHGRDNATCEVFASAYGNLNMALEGYSSAFGSQNRARGFASSAFGDANRANGAGSSAFGT